MMEESSAGKATGYILKDQANTAQKTLTDISVCRQFLDVNVQTISAQRLENRQEISRATKIHSCFKNVKNLNQGLSGLS